MQYYSNWDLPPHMINLRKSSLRAQNPAKILIIDGYRKDREES